MTSQWYSTFIKALWDQDLDPTDDLKIMLVDGYTFDPEHTYAQIEADETSGAGYTAGGQVFTFSSVTASPTGTAFAQPQVEWTAATLDATGAVVYSDGATKRPMYYLSFGTQRSVLGGIFRILAPNPPPAAAITPCP
jgi:predicted exporter